MYAPIPDCPNRHWTEQYVYVGKLGPVPAVTNVTIRPTTNIHTKYWYSIRSVDLSKIEDLAPEDVLWYEDIVARYGVSELAEHDRDHDLVRVRLLTRDIREVKDTLHLFRICKVRFV